MVRIIKEILEKRGSNKTYCCLVSGLMGMGRFRVLLPYFFKLLPQPPTRES